MQVAMVFLCKASLADIALKRFDHQVLPHMVPHISGYLRVILALTTEKLLVLSATFLIVKELLVVLGSYEGFIYVIIWVKIC